MGSDGTHRRHLTDGRDSTPAWSRDGRRIVFSRAVGANKDELWLMNADGTGAHRLAGGLGGVSPDFSPDGRRIVFYSRESGAEVIYEIDANGGEPARITDGRDPRWLLDSSLVLSVRGGLNNTWRIVRLDHGRLRTIVDTEGDELIPIPSFDGRWITFASASPDAPGGTHAKANG